MPSENTGPIPQYQPPPSPQLPDYKPRGMSNLDKILAWLVGIVLLIFVLTFAGKYLSRDLQPATHPAVKAVATAHPTAAKKAAKAKVCSG